MPKKILLADDSITIQKVIAITFANEDYDLVITGDGSDALEKAREIKPDLVMADVAMPGMNGYELCEAIKKDSSLAGTPVMLLAGTFEPLDAGKAASAGADDHIVKPFESHDLLDKVRGMIGAAPAGTSEAPPAAESSTETGAWSGTSTEEPWGEGDFLDFSEEFGEKPDTAPLDAGASEEPVESFGAAFEVEEKPAGAGEKEGADRWGMDFEETKEPEFVDIAFGDEELKTAEAPSSEVAAEPVVEEATAEPSWTVPPVAEEPEQVTGAGGYEGTSFGGAFWGEEETGAEGPISEEASAAPQADSEPEPEFDIGDFEVPSEAIEAETEAEAAVEPESFDAGIFGVPSEEPVAEAPAPEPVSTPDAFTEAALEAAVPAVEERAVAEVQQRLAGEVNISRETIEEVVARVAREVIEEVAWEVVPELAEELINNELLKVRNAFAKMKA